jgi:hypothetical protein
VAKILFVWELGRGFGHLSPYLDFVRALKRNGHQITYAARDIGNTDRIFAKEGIPIIQAPIEMRDVTDPAKVQYTYGHIMHNVGFADPTDLFARVKAWTHVFHYTAPDLVLFDHSPTALVAARAFRFKRVMAGSGFLVPPPGVPLPVMRYWDR